MRIYISLLFCLSLLSCDYFNFSKKHKKKIVEERIKEIKANGLELYPEILPCKQLSGKECFERRLTKTLKNSFKNSIEVLDISKTDTVWITVHINNHGIISLHSTLPKATKKINQILTNILEELSPIKAATINGTPVNSTFKIPLILKKEN